jgi:hypothetical protein
MEKETKDFLVSLVALVERMGLIRLGAFGFSLMTMFSFKDVFNNPNHLIVKTIIVIVLILFSGGKRRNIYKFFYFMTASILLVLLLTKMYEISYYWSFVSLVASIIVIAKRLGIE